MSILLRRLCVLRTPASVRAWSTLSPELFEDSAVPVLEEDEETIKRARKLEKSRNKSQLSREHFNIVNERRPYRIEEPKIKSHLTVKYHRKMYGKYGEESGVNPSLCWPSSKDIADTKEYESVAYPYTILKMMDDVAKRKSEEKKKIQFREEQILVKLGKMEQWKKDLNDRMEKKMAIAQAAKEKRERLVEEVRRHFGFKLDHRDERFQEMLVKREKEQKKLEKQVKREAKEKEMLAKIQQKMVAETPAAENKGGDSP